MRRSLLLLVGGVVLLGAAMAGLGWSASASSTSGSFVARLNPILSAPLAPMPSTITVTSPNDSGVGSLRDAIANASPGDTINFDSGITTINLTSGGFSIDKNLTINGPGANLLTVQRSTASGTPQFRIFDITNGLSVTISGLTVSNGNSVGSIGGAIRIDRSTVTVTNCAFTQNSADVGGAIASLGQFGTANLTITNSTFSQNSAISGGLGQGAAVYSLGEGGTANLTVTDSTFTQNAALEGAGIFNVALNDNSFANLTVVNSTFSQNTCNVDGGGLTNAGDDGGVAIAKITSTTFSENTAQEGGAIINITPDGIANMTLVNCTLSQNTASADSGGILNDAFEGGTATLTVRNSTLSQNSSGSGGGIFNYTHSTFEVGRPQGNAILQIGNTIFKKGAQGANLVSDPDGIVTSLGHNLTDDSAGAGAGTGPAGYLNQPGDIRNTDPLLGALANNGGLTQTHLLLPGSPAIDAGSNALAVDQNNNPLTTDQRGFPRIVNVTVDIGAVEVSSGPSPSLSIVQQPTNATAGQAISPALTVAILDELGQPTTSTANVSISIGTNPSGGILSGTTTVAAVNGTATFNNLSINKAGTGYTLNATSSGVTAATSNPFNITAGAPNKLGFGQQPSSAVLGQVISPPVTVQIVDAFNNPTTSTANVSISIGTNPSGGTLSGTTPVAAVNGIATFNNLSINLGGSGYTLSAASSGLTGATSNAFNITGSPTHITATAGGGQSTSVGITFSTALKATVTDDFTVLNGVSVTFTAPSSGASGTFAGGGTTVTVSTDINGVATAPAFTANSTTGTYNVTANVTPTLPTPATFNLTNNACGGGSLVTNNNDSGSGSLRDVIANACAGSTITFGPGVVSPITLTGGGLLIDKNLTITGPGSNLLTVQRSTAGGTPQFRIFSITHPSTLSLSGLTISNGNSIGGNGGAIQNERGTLTVTNCNFTQNSADIGGAISNLGDFGTANLTIVNSTFSQNFATSGTFGQGGAIYSVGADFNGIATLTITNSTFNQNSAKEGGAIFSVALGAGKADVSLVNSTFSQNNASLAGGGLVNAGDDGGTATVKATNTTFSQNTSNEGGGILNISPAGIANLAVVNSTFSQNTGTTDGGGIFNDSSEAGTATLSLTNSTFCQNSAPTGGGVFNFTLSTEEPGTPKGFAILQIGNTIFKKGASGANILSDPDGVVTSLGHNLSDDAAGAGAGTGPAGYLNQTGDIRNTDPLLSVLTNNGGPTQTHLLLAGSPAIDQGSNAIAVDQNSNPLTTDQRGTGFPRIVNSTVDIGAVEGVGNQTITVNTHAPAIAGFNNSFTVAATASSGLPVTYSSAGVCTNVGATFTMTSNTGTCTVKYDQAGNSSYNPAPQVTESVTAQEGAQTITVNTHAPPTAAFNSGFTVAATASSGLPVTYSSAGVCTNVGATFTMTSGTGTCTVKYDQAGNGLFTAASQVTESVTAQKVDQTITVNTHAPATAGFNSSFTVAATSSSGSPVTYSSSGVCTNVGATFTMTSGTGTCTVKYDQAGNSNFNSATQVTEPVTAQKGSQTITVNQHAPASAAVNSSFTVAATSNSGLTVAYSSAGACTNVGATFTMASNGGTCTVKYDQAGDASYNAAPQVTESVKANQTITVNTHAPAVASLNSSFTVAATSSSGLPVTYSSSGVCTNVGATFTMTSGTGTCTVNFDQAGDASFNAAPQVTESVTAQKANQTITFGALANKTFGDPDFTVSATASSALSVSFGAVGNCTVTGTTVHITSAGSCTITASQAGNGNFNPATNVPQSFNIAKAATTTAVSSSNNPSGLSQSVTFTATVTSAAGTPTGTVQFKDNGTNLGAAQALNGSGVATLATSALTAGTHTITADYSGDVNFAVSTGTLSGGQVVNNQALISFFPQPTYNVNEGAGFLTVTVNRSGITSSAVTVDYATSDGTASLLPCSTANGSASSRCDFTTALGTLSFAAGETSKTFVVLITQDSYVEGDETFTASLTNPTGGAALVSPASAIITIKDDLTEPSTNPNDVPSDFVRQHYHDFLNREADQSGLNFWIGNFTPCGTNQQCIDVARINVSASFFLSIEFQGTGYLVERLYKSAYADASGTSTVGGSHQIPVPIVRLNEFLHDSQEIGLGVVVGQGNWEQVLENNKQAFTAEFVQRARFTTAFPITMTPAQFVDTLNANAGNPLSPSERNQLVNDLTSNAKTRAQVLRAVAEDPDLVTAEFNRAFVLMQFLGYLRRNPNDQPDTDYSGYDFWLTKLNQFNGNFQNAEMVKAFITSLEYRKRFGQ